MKLRDTKWLAEKLGISVSTIEKLRTQQSDELPKSITINRSVRYDEAYVDWWLQKKLHENFPEYSQWLQDMTGGHDKPDYSNTKEK